MAGRCSCSSVPFTSTQLAAAFGLAVGFAWGVLAIFTLLASLCVFPAREDSLIWLVYFFDPKCGWEAPAFLKLLSPGWPGEDGACPAVLRTRALAASRLALAGARVISSIALLVVERWQRMARREGRPPSPCFPIYFAWLLSALLDIVLDAILVPFYALDISHSAGAENVMHLLGVSTLTPGWAQALPEWVTQSPALPPVVLLVVGSRAAPFLWVPEIMAVARVAATARFLHKQRRLTRPSVRDSQEVPSTSHAGLSPGPSRGAGPAEEPMAGPSGETFERRRGAHSPPPPTRTDMLWSSDSEDEGHPESLRTSALGEEAPTPSPRASQRSSWARLSFLECLPVPGGGGDRRWSYVPLSTQPLPDRHRPASHLPT